MTVRRLDDIPPHASEVPGVVARRLKRVEDVELKVMDIAAGHGTPFHVHSHAHDGIVMAGSGALRVDDGEAIPLTPGDTFAIHPHEPHAIENHETLPLRILCLDCYVD